MKRHFITAVLISLGLSAAAQVVRAPGGAAGGNTTIYQVFGPLILNANPPQIVADTFVNYSDFDLRLSITTTNFNNAVGIGYDVIPYTPNGVDYYTNAQSGTMIGVPGFWLDKVSNTSRGWAKSFHNDGNVTGQDIPGFPEIFSTSSGTTAIVADSQPVSSHLQVDAASIFNDGIMAVGNYGLLQLNGQSVNTANGVLSSGSVNTAGGNGVSYDPLDVTGGALSQFYSAFKYYVNPVGVYDLYWGISNYASLDFSTFDPPYGLPTHIDGEREGFGGYVGNAFQQFATYADTYTDASGSNTYFNIIYVNTNFTDLNGNTITNISVNYGFSGYYALNSQIGDPLGELDTVEFAETVTDVTTGALVTNAIFVQDLGGIATTAVPPVEYDDAQSADGYSRPSPFAITTTPPLEWPGRGSNTTFSNALINTPQVYTATKVGVVTANYGAQIGRNPATLDGGFNFTDSIFTVIGSNIITTGTVTGTGSSIILPDPTNEAARIEINAGQLNLSNSRLRAEGMVIINASNLMGVPLAADWGEANLNLTQTNGTLNVSGIMPSNFQRLRGYVYLSSYSWVASVTNNIQGPPLTNTFHFHIFVVDQNLGANFQPAVRSLKLTATNSINLNDNLYVINNYTINSQNITNNGTLTLTQSAGDLYPANFPNLQNFFNTGTVTLDGALDIGFNINQAPTPPDGRKYTVQSITNWGTMSGASPVLQAQSVENDGSIIADANGSMIIEAASIGGGLDMINPQTVFEADNNVTLSAINMQFTNTEILAGGLFETNRGQLQLQSSTDGQITDGLVGAASTNVYGTNVFIVTDGVNLPVKPATGDLFGTEIIEVATNFTQSVTTWAGVDMGASSAGFSDNMVVGILTLSRQSETASLHFTGAGAQNAMYVDYLQLDPNSLSYSNYKSGLVIDPNLTIYFAACNVDPVKLETIYTNRLVWVPSFAGPNSSVAVPYENSSNFCLLNVSVYNSTEMGFFGVPNLFNQPYVLNNPTNPSITYPCPSATANFVDYTVPAGTNRLHVEITTHGGGSIDPVIKPGKMVMGGTYTLTAKPAKGWTFGGWTGSGLPASADTASATFYFTLQTNLILTANFTPQTFTLVKGSYDGLFGPTNGANFPANNGAFSFVIGANGSASGRLQIGEETWPFSGSFSTAGALSANARHGGSSAQVSLQLDMTGGSGTVTGTVTEGSVTVPLAGYLAPGWNGFDPSPFKGAYTMAFGNISTTNGPAGYGYAFANVNASGVVSITGKLADGNSFSQTAQVSQSGLWPFYAGNTAGADVISGWLQFQDIQGIGRTISLTNVMWSKGAVPRAVLYPNGFTGIFEVQASSYVNPGRKSAGLSLTNNGQAVLSWGGLETPLNLDVTNIHNLSFVGNGVNLTVNPATGLATGKVEGVTGATGKVSGAVLQTQDAVFGFLPGANGESEEFLLEAK